jgi:hypothetical protein
MDRSASLSATGGAGTSGIKLLAPLRWAEATRAHRCHILERSTVEQTGSPSLISAVSDRSAILMQSLSRAGATCARSSTDRASDYGSEGLGFESLRARKSFRSSARHSSASAVSHDGPVSLNRSLNCRIASWVRIDPCLQPKSGAATAPAPNANAVPACGRSACPPRRTRPQPHLRTLSCCTSRR